MSGVCKLQRKQRSRGLKYQRRLWKEETFGQGLKSG